MPAASALPNTLEPDTTIRSEPSPGRVGDLAADVQPVERLTNKAVLEGAYR